MGNALSTALPGAGAGAGGMGGRQGEIPSQQPAPNGRRSEPTSRPPQQQQQPPPSSSSAAADAAAASPEGRTPGSTGPGALFPLEKDTDEVAELLSKTNLSTPSLHRQRLSFTPTIPEDGRERVRNLYRNRARIVHGFGPGGLAPLTKSVKAPAPGVAIADAASKSKPKGEVIPIILSWSGGGKTVFVTGSFNNWNQKIRMIQSTADFTTIIDMPRGTHKFKFIVDNEWKCSEDFPVGNDEEGNLINFLKVQDEMGSDQRDGLDALARDVDALAKLKPPAPPDSRFIRDIPTYLTDNRTLLTPLDANGYPDESIKRLPGYNYIPPPPVLPCHLERVFLNAREEATTGPPSHAVLHHLYASSIKDGVMAVGSTSRYRSKYATVILYKPLVGGS